MQLGVNGQDRQSSPRLGHLVLWVVGCAIGLAVYRLLTPSLNVAFRPWGFAYSAAMGVAFGTMLAGSTVLTARRCQGDHSIPSDPGHWLLLLGLGSAAANGMAIVASAWLSGCDRIAIHWAQFRIGWEIDMCALKHQVIAWSLGAIVSGVLLVWAWPSLAPHWRLVWVGMLMTAVALGIGNLATLVWVLIINGELALLWKWWSSRVYAASMGGCCLLILMAIVRDGARDQRRDFLHWAGVGSWLMIAGIQLTLLVRYVWLP